MKDSSVRPRAQWGRDKRRGLGPIAPPVTDRRIALGRVAMIITVVAWVGYVVTWIFDDFLNHAASSAVDRTESVVYLLIVTTLTVSTVAYLMSRLGFFYRVRAHHRSSRGVLDQFYAEHNPSLTMLIPSYQEDKRVVRNTLISAALQEYKGLRIVLLIDDPPAPRTRAAFELLRDARELPSEIAELLAGPMARFSASHEGFLTRQAGRRGSPGEDARFGVPPQELEILAGEYDAAVSWLRELADAQEIIDHGDEFLAEQVIGALAEDLAQVADALRLALDERAELPEVRLTHLYQRLLRIFDVELAWFQRKQYASLSHEPNKAMNLNSYLGLMGGRHREVQTLKGPALVPAGPESVADLEIPDPDYVVTLDADSVLLPEYCLRLVQLLEQAEYREISIAQTPYSAFPGAATRLERMAGATTDLQHIVHQGLTYYEATFWVGANAVIRKRALDDIAVTSYIGDWQVKTFIRDRTVIEDTESTIDMGIHGWKLFNVPERLSYSATPPDFGSLCIQRRRWATGGLILLSRLHQQSKTRKALGQSTRFGELFLRSNYMASISWSSLSLLILLVFPFHSTLISPWLFLVALPYFAAMGSDLRYCGYKWTDTIRIYGFNLILLPVNLAGVVATLSQILTSSKAAFARTPKVRDRTVTPPLYLLAPFLLVILSALTGLYAYDHHRHENMVYAALNTILTAYAIVAFIGLWNCLVDTGVHIRRALSKPTTGTRRSRRTAAAQAPAAQALLDWREVLQVSDQGDHSPWRTGHQIFVREPDTPSSRFDTLFQPIVDLRTSRVTGYEALSRFRDGTLTPKALEAAEDLGWRAVLEAELAEAAVMASSLLPTDLWLAVKASAAALDVSPTLVDMLGRGERAFLLEVSAQLEDIAAEIHQISQLMPSTCRLVLEHATLNDATRELVQSGGLRFIKLHGQALAGIAEDQARQGQLKRLLSAAAAHRCQVIATGIEQEEDISFLVDHGVHLGQGYALGRPEEAAHALN